MIEGWKYLRKVEVCFPFYDWISLIILSLWFTFPICKMGSLEAVRWNVHYKPVMPTASCTDPLHGTCQQSTAGDRLCSLPSGIPTVAPCQEWALVSAGACGCSGEMAAQSRILLWLEDFSWIPHCPLSIPKWFRRETHVAKPGPGVLTSYMWPMSCKRTLLV